jgi:hypothetical protein
MGHRVAVSASEASSAMTASAEGLMRKIALLKRLTMVAGLWATTLVAPTPARADVILFQDFDDVTTLAGWTQTNNSTPGGVTSWFQGNEGVFAAQDGPDNSYIAANFLNAGFGGNISNWLILPELTFYTGDTLTFFTRSGAFFDDRLEVRFSAGSGSDVGGTDASVGTFTTLFLTVNPVLNGSYPSDWTQYSVGLSAADGLSGRLAFRYNVTDTNANGDYIGIDTVAVNRVPEPGTLALMSLGLVGLIARRRRSSALLQKGA